MHAQLPHRLQILNEGEIVLNGGDSIKRVRQELHGASEAGVEGIQRFVHRDVHAAFDVRCLI